MKYLPILAGMASTTLFVVSYLPMLGRVRTRDLASYSRPSLVLANVGNVDPGGLRLQPAGRAHLVPARLLPGRQRPDVRPPPPPHPPGDAGTERSRTPIEGGVMTTTNDDVSAAWADASGRSLRRPGSRRARMRGAWNLNADHRARVVVAEDRGRRRAVRFARTRRARRRGDGHRARHRDAVPRGPADQHLADAGGRGSTRTHGDARCGRATSGGRRRRGAPHGLAGLAGSSTRVGVVGYTLGGGFGWLGRRFGLAAHSRDRAKSSRPTVNCVAAVPKSTRTCSGARGGTGNSASSPPWSSPCTRSQGVRGQSLLPAGSGARRAGILRRVESVAAGELTAAVTFRASHRCRRVPEPLRGRSLVALRGCFCGDPATGAALVDEARQPSARRRSTPSPRSGRRRSPRSAWIRSIRWRARATASCWPIFPERVDALIELAGPGRITAGDAGAPAARRRARRSGRRAEPDGAHRRGSASTRSG